MALAGNQDLAIFSPLFKLVESVQSKAAFLLLFAMAAEASRLQNGSNIFGVGEAFLLGCGR